MKTFEWRITDDLKNMTINDLNDNPEIYGFLKLSFNSLQFGYIIEDYEFEGNNDILYWVRKALKCVIAMKNHKNFSQQLFSSNLVNINVEYGNPIVVKAVNNQTDEIYNQEMIDFMDLKEYVLDFTNSFLTEIEGINADLLESEEIKKIIILKNESIN